MSGPSPLVSVIINAYNGERYLRETIESVYAQTLQDFEIVLFDDASTDATPEIARSFDGRLRYFSCERPVSLGEARNRALDQALGKYLSFLDQDDLFLPKKLERQVAAFQGNVGLVFSNCYILWENFGRETLRYKSRPVDGDAFRALLRGYYLSINTVMIRRNALPMEREWWFPSSFMMCEETDLFLRLAYAYPIAYVDEPLAKYRVHGGNFSILHREHLSSEQNRMIERLGEAIPDFFSRYAVEISSLRHEIKRTEAQFLWRGGRNLMAWANYLKILLQRPTLSLLAEFALCLFIPFETWRSIRERLGKPIL